MLGTGIKIAIDTKYGDWLSLDVSIIRRHSADIDWYREEDEYMSGIDLLVALVLEGDARSREVYFPVDSTWKNVCR